MRSNVLGLLFISAVACTPAADAPVDTDTDAVDTDTDVIDTDTDAPVDTDTDLPVDTDTDVPADTDTDVVDTGASPV